MLTRTILSLPCVSHTTQWLFGLACCLALLGFSTNTLADKATERPTDEPAKAASNSVEDVRPQVLINTNHGNFTLELYPRKAPETVKNFLQLVADGFYTDVLFHRVIANFMVQTGGFDLDMATKDAPRTVVNESFNGLRNRKGFIAMARTEDPDSADTQFFINVRDNTRLDAKPGLPGYTVFGRVIDGWRNVESIELVNTGISHGMSAVPMEPIILESAERVR